MAKSKEPETPVTTLKRKLEGSASSSTISKRARQNGSSKPTSTRKTPRSRQAPSEATPSTATDFDDTFMTAHSELNEDTPRAKTAASVSSDADLTPTKNHWNELQAVASNAESNDPRKTDAKIVERRRKRKEDKKARRLAEQKKALSQTVDPSVSRGSKKSKKAEREEADAIESTIETQQDPTRQPAWSLTQSTAGRFLDQGPVFVRDAQGKEALVAAKSCELQLLNLESSLVQATQKAPPGLLIRSITGSEGGDGAVYVIYSDGSLAQWNTRTNSIKSIIRPTLASPHIAAIRTDSDGTDEVIAIEHSKGGSGISLNGKVIFKTQHQLFSLHLIRGSEFVLCLGRFAAVVGRRKNAAKGDYVWVELPMQRTITCGDARVVRKKKSKDAVGLQLAIGTSDGQIHLYDDVLPAFAQSSPSLSTPRILHWHMESVCALTFSQDGHYLMSGGRETVLVLWQLTTGKKHYLPHLSSTIEQISVNGTGDRFALQMGDNSIMVLSTSELKPVANFAGLQIAQPVLLDAASTISQRSAVLDPNNQNQILLTVPATQPRLADDVSARPFLQTYDVRDGRHISRQAMSRNNVTDFRLGPNKEPIVPPDVCHVQISTDGQWLATVDEWSPPLADMATLAPQETAEATEKSLQRREAHLKFWCWNAQEHMWTLVTRVDAPHARHERDALGAGKVFAVVSDPSGDGFATIGEDGLLRIWRPKLRNRLEVTAQNYRAGETRTWICRRTIELPRDVDRADSPMADDDKQAAPESACLAFSEDGSMIAAGQSMSSSKDAPLVHFIRASTGDVVTKATVAPSSLESLAFVDRYLISVGQKAVHIWDYVENALSSRLSLPADRPEHPLLSVNRSNKTFAVALQHECFVYKLGEVQKIHSMTLETPLVALLASQRGYILLFADATVRRLLPTSVLEHDQRIDATEDTAADLTDDVAETSVDLVNKLSQTSLTAESREGAAAEDDRPVVRPQQLANALETSSSVEDMFQAVFGLFGRRPRQSTATTTTSS